MITPMIDIPPMPAEFPGLLGRSFSEMRKDHRRRCFQGFYVLATSGLAVGMELRQVLADALGLQPENGSLFRVLMETLPGLGLAVKSTPVYLGHSRLALLRLTDPGRRFAYALGWQPVKNEWDQLIEGHYGLRYPRHTVGLLAFAMHARLRDWQVELLPELHRRLLPDVKVFCPGGGHVYVEFERRSRARQAKWRKLVRAQGFVAIATFSTHQRARLIKEAKLVSPAGVACDLVALVKQQHSGNPGPLWLESWGADRLPPALSQSLSGETDWAVS